MEVRYEGILQCLLSPLEPGFDGIQWRKIAERARVGRKENYRQAVVRTRKRSERFRIDVSAFDRQVLQLRQI